MRCKHFILWMLNLHNHFGILVSALMIFLRTMESPPTILLALIGLWDISKKVCVSVIVIIIVLLLLLLWILFLLVLSHIFGLKLFIQLYSIKVVVYDVQAEWPITFRNPGWCWEFFFFARYTFHWYK